MSKSVLVMETPEWCADCSLLVGCTEANPKCNAVNKPIDYIDKRPDWCPLKPLPEKRGMQRPTDYEYGKMHGWNAYIDEITGEGR